MTLELAILGLLSLHPLTGYDIKKIFEESPTFYWSGSNNQIYHTLVALHQQGFLTRQVQLQEDHPARKIYSITEKGLEKLKEWVSVMPELPQLKQSFLIQLAWADVLPAADLDAILAQYEEQVQMQLLMLGSAASPSNPALKRKRPQEYLDPNRARSRRESILWTSILQNRHSFYENELRWMKELRAQLSSVK